MPLAFPTLCLRRWSTSRACARIAAMVSLSALAAIVPAGSAQGRQALSGSSVRAGLANLKLVDYFPAKNGWSNMWTRWDPATIDSDFARIAGLGGTGVRIVVRPDAFGFPSASPVMASRLAWVVGAADNHGLRVTLTLFDGWSGWPDVDGSRRWARALLDPYRDDRRIAYIDLHNEINREPAGAQAWASNLLPYVQDVVGSVPVTASVTVQDGADGLMRLRDAVAPAQPDFYDLHYYGPDGLAYARLSAARTEAAPRPVFIGETGYSTWTGDVGVASNLPRSEQSLEAYQDYYYRSVAYAALRLGAPAPAPWILYDFAPGAMMAGSWETNWREYHFGIFRSDGSPKPVARTLKAVFSTGTVDADFNRGFETATNRPGAPDVPALWRLWREADAQFAWDPGTSHSGSASARISHAGGDNSGAPAFYVTPVGAAVEPDVVYTASAWARTSAATGSSRVSLSWFDSAGAYIGQNESPSISRTVGWTKLSASGRPPAGAAFAQIFLKSRGNSGTVWFDDAAFDPVVPVVASMPTSVTAPAPEARPVGSSVAETSGSAPPETAPLNGLLPFMGAAPVLRQPAVAKQTVPAKAATGRRCRPSSAKLARTRGSKRSAISACRTATPKKPRPDARPRPRTKQAGSVVPPKR